ncbi:omptin family outer membrane protease [Pseudomonas viridiflava]|uniref:omptin family outer membrane protease n=1 Tax=Pseudomonas viridiflava TaxID=33069 RepID=UPI0013C2DACC|nr:omptin family outer membrane protease [Pseudomonas viridiflava]
MLINVRETLVLLGLVAFGHEALADAKVFNEQKTKLGSIELNLGVGLLNGRSLEKVYDDGEKVSQLNWDIKQVPTLHLGLTYNPLDWLSLEARGWTRMAAGNSHMKDYDWSAGEDADWTDYSNHPDTRLKNAWQAEFAATGWALKRGNVALGVMAGYQRTRFDWQARGGSYVYSSDNGDRDVTGDFPSGLKVITYQQTYDTPYLGLVGLYNLQRWSLEGRFKYSQWVKARDFDSHHLRNLTFSGNNGDRGRMQSLALALSYQMTPQFSVKAGLDHQVYSEAKGSALIKHAPSGDSLRTGDKSNSQSNRTTVSSLALAYQF